MVPKIIQVKGFSNDAPAIDTAAWLATSGLTWSTVPGSTVMGRNMDESLPDKQGWRLILVKPDVPQPSLKTQVKSGGLLTITLDDPFDYGTDFQVTANGQPAVAMGSGYTDAIRTYAIPAGSNEIALWPQAHSTLISIEWKPTQGTEAQNFIHAGIDGRGLDFAPGDGTRVMVRTSQRSYGLEHLAFLPGNTTASLTSTIRGPGILTFEWLLESSTGRFTMGEVPVIMASTFGTYNTSRSAVSLSVPAGIHPVAWLTSSHKSMQLSKVHWMPSAGAHPPVAGLLAGVKRQGNRFWWQRRVGEDRVLTLPWDKTPGGETAVSMKAEGPGIFVCEARLLTSSILPHFAVQHGRPSLELKLDGIPVLTAMSSEEWLPLAVPLPGGTHAVELGLLTEFGEGATQALGLYPATIEIRSANVTPTLPAAALNGNGLNWEPALRTGGMGDVASSLKARASSGFFQLIVVSSPTRLPPRWWVRACWNGNAPIITGL